MSEELRLSFALDTNFISRAVRCPSARTVRLLHSDNIQVCTSRTCYGEVQAGTPSGELEFLTDLKSLVLGIPSDETATGPDYWDVAQVKIDRSGDAANRMLVGFFRKIAGTNSDCNLADSLMTAVYKTMSSVAGEIEEFGFTKYREDLIQLAKEAAHSTPEIFREPGFIISTEEAKESRIDPLFLNNYSPPLVAQKILAGLSDDARIAISELLPPRSPKTYNALQRAGLTLTAIGFQKDKRIQKTSSEVSEKGASAQWRDIEHITACAGVNCFATMDSGCAKLAFTLYEALEIDTLVLHIEPKNFEHGTLRVVGPDYWP